MENQEKHTHEMEIFNAFSNIAAHMHMADGWIDSLFPYQKVLHMKNPTILPQLVKARSERNHSHCWWKTIILVFKQIIPR